MVSLKFFRNTGCHEKSDWKGPPFQNGVSWGVRPGCSGIYLVGFGKPPQDRDRPTGQPVLPVKKFLLVPSLNLSGFNVCLCQALCPWLVSPGTPSHTPVRGSESPFKLRPWRPALATLDVCVALSLALSLAPSSSAPGWSPQRDLVHQAPWLSVVPVGSTRLCPWGCVPPGRTSPALGPPWPPSSPSLWEEAAPAALWQPVVSHRPTVPRCEDPPGRLLWGPQRLSLFGGWTSPGPPASSPGAEASAPLPSWRSSAELAAVDGFFWKYSSKRTTSVTGQRP